MLFLCRTHVNTACATLGVHGNALFFLVSGYLLFSSLQKNEFNVPFGKWYQQKVKRLWLPIIVLGILIGFWHPDITWIRFMPSLWFVKCFLVSFPIIFFIIKMKRMSFLWGAFVASIVLMILIVFCHSRQPLSIFHFFHYYCYFPVILLGVIIAKYQDVVLKNNNGVISFICTIISFGLYFVVMKFGKGQINSSLYYTQLLGYIPLFLFLFYMFKCTNTEWIKTFSLTKYFWPIKVVAALTFDIYIVQHYIITDTFNALYPFNTVIVFLLIVLAAYLVRSATKLFEQIMDGNGWNLKDAFKI